MAAWAELSAQLEAVGFRAVCWVEASCGKHGDFRGAVELESESVRCPKCDRPIEAALLGRGLTRQTEIGWECVSLPTPASAKRTEKPIVAQRDRQPHDPERQERFYERARREIRQLQMEADDTNAPRTRERRPTQAEMRARIQVVAQMLAAGECHHAIAHSVFPHALEPESNLRILFSRRGRDIQQQMSLLRA
jgi:hypothetical protein